MRFWRVLAMRLRSLFNRSDADDQTRRELQLHLDLLTREKLAAGLIFADARDAALREMGNLSLLAEESRDNRRVRYFHDLTDDLAFAFRLLRKSPVFTAVSVLSIGLGIGANTAIFTLIKRSYLEMLPVREPERIVRINRSNIAMPELSSFSYPLYRELAAANTALEGIVCTSDGRVALSAGTSPAESIAIQLVSGNFYETLGVQPFLGRLLTPDDNRVVGGHPVIVLSYNYWRRRFGADPRIVGQTVRLNTQPMTVIGVSPPGFDGLGQGWSPDAVIPVMMQPQAFQMNATIDQRGHWWLNVAGRLKPGETLKHAELSLQPLIRRYFDESAQRPGETAYVRQVLQSNRVHVRPTATGWHRDPAAAANSMAMLGMTGIVLLAACVNLTNLLLARAAARRNEISMRLALGAGRFRLIRQLLTESLLLASFGGALGLLLSVGAGPILLRLARGDDPQITQSMAPDFSVMLF